MPLTDAIALLCQTAPLSEDLRAAARAKLFSACVSAVTCDEIEHEGESLWVRLWLNPYRLAMLNAAERAAAVARLREACGPILEEEGILVLSETLIPASHAEELHLAFEVSWESIEQVRRLEQELALRTAVH